MYQDADLRVTSIKSLASTISTDRQVRRWFTYLILHQTVRRELSNNKEIESAYKRIKNIFLQEKIICILSVCILLLAVMTHQWECGLGAAILLGINGFLQAKNKKSIIKVCDSLISRDFNQQSFAQKTLYQIGEIYSRKYNIISLVDAVTSTEALTRKAVLYMFVFATFIYPLNFWQTCGSVLVVYYIFYGIVGGALFIFRRSK